VQDRLEKAQGELRTEIEARVKAETRIEGGERLVEELRLEITRLRDGDEPPRKPRKPVGK